MSKGKSVVSKLSFKSQMVLPREVRERLRVGPGDRVRFLLGSDFVRIEKEILGAEDEPFAAFSEWSSRADEDAYRDL